VRSLRTKATRRTPRLRLLEFRILACVPLRCANKQMLVKDLACRVLGVEDSQSLVHFFNGCVFVLHREPSRRTREKIDDVVEFSM